MNGTGAVQQSAENPYYGQADVSGAFSGCAIASDAARAVEAMLDYWENAEQRAALEGSLTRTQELLRDAQNAQASGTGSADAVSALQSRQTELNGQISVCTTEMAKAAMAAAAAGGGDPALYDLSELSVLFDPTTLQVNDLALVAAAYAQAGGDADSADSAADDARTLALKTALADLTAAYSGVNSARSTYEQAASAASDAAGAYAMGTGSKAGWYEALSARADSQTALYQAVGVFTRQANTLNELTGGWVSRTQDWLAEALLPLYDTSAQ